MNVEMMGIMEIVEIVVKVEKIHGSINSIMAVNWIRTTFNI